MKPKTIFILLGILILIIIGCFYAYAWTLGSMWTLNTPDENPYYISSKPLVIKNISLPAETKISYKKRFFWEKNEQSKALREEDLTDISFKEGVSIDWGGVPITSITRFYNSGMKGYRVYADFNSLEESKETPFSKLWQSCNGPLDIMVEHTTDWSFNKKNILDIASCSIHYQRSFKEDIKQQKFLDYLFSELMKTKD